MSHSRNEPTPASPPFTAPCRLLPLVMLVLSLCAAPALALEEEATAEPEGGAAAAAEQPPSETAVPADAPADAPEETLAPAPRAAEDLAWEIEGYLSLWGEFRWVDGESGTNLFLDVVTDARRGGDVPIHARVNGRMIVNLGDAESGDWLYDTWDTFDSEVQVRMYEAYVEGERMADGLLGLRGGRMFLNEGIWLHFDGLRADLDFEGDLDDLKVSVLGGIPVKFGEDSRNESWLAGLVAHYKLAASTRLRFEYYHVSEYFDGINDPVVDPPQQPVSVPSERIEDDYLGLTAWHTIGRKTSLFGRFTLLNGDANEIHLRARWRTEDGLWLVIGEYYQLFGRLNNVTNDLSPYVPMLGSYEPFLRLSLTATRRISELWVLQLGLSHRELLDEDDEGQYNHEYNQGTLSATRLGLLDGKLDATLLGQGYSASGDDFAVLAGHVDYRLDEKWVLRGGIDYSYYKYDYLLDTEHENVWTYSVEGRYKINPRTTARARLAVSDDRFETWTTLDLRISLRF